MYSFLHTYIIFYAQGLELDPEGFLVQTLVDVLEQLFEFEEGELDGQGNMML